MSYYWNAGYVDGERNEVPDYNLFTKGGSQWTEDQRKLYFKGYRCGVRNQDKKKRKAWAESDQVLVPEPT